MANPNAVFNFLLRRLTGLSTAVATAVTESDNILQAIGKLQGQVTNIVAAAKLRYNLTSTWSALPAANSVPINTRYFVSDIGINGSDWYSDGIKWRLVNGRITLFADNSARVFTGSTSIALPIFSVPANVMGDTGSIDITTLMTCNNNSNAKSFFLRYGGLSVMGIGLTSVESAQMQTIIRNRSKTSQIAAIGTTGIVYGGATADIRRISADTGISQTINAEAILSQAADTVTLESIRIDLIA